MSRLGDLLGRIAPAPPDQDRATARPRRGGFRARPAVWTEADEAAWEARRAAEEKEEAAQQRREQDAADAAHLAHLAAFGERFAAALRAYEAERAVKLPLVETCGSLNTIQGEWVKAKRVHQWANDVFSCWTPPYDLAPPEEFKEWALRRYARGQVNGQEAEHCQIANAELRRRGLPEETQVVARPPRRAMKPQGWYPERLKSA